MTFKGAILQIHAEPAPRFTFIETCQKLGMERIVGNLHREQRDALENVARILISDPQWLVDFFAWCDNYGRQWFINCLNEYGHGEKLFRRMQCWPCLLCSAWRHELDMDQGGHFCMVCAADLIYLGHQLHHVSDNLRRGRPIGEPKCAPRRQG